jgi:hypothetical protein
MAHRSSTFQAPPPGSNGEEGQLYGLKLRREDRRLALVAVHDRDAAHETRETDLYDLPFSQHGAHGFGAQSPCACVAEENKCECGGGEADGCVCSDSVDMKGGE